MLSFITCLIGMVFLSTADGKAATPASYTSYLVNTSGTASSTCTLAGAKKEIHNGTTFYNISTDGYTEEYISFEKTTDAVIVTGVLKKQYKTTYYVGSKLYIDGKAYNIILGKSNGYSATNIPVYYMNSNGVYSTIKDCTLTYYGDELQGRINVKTLNFPYIKEVYPYSFNSCSEVEEIKLGNSLSASDRLG